MKRILLATAVAAALPMAAQASVYLPTQGNPNSIQHEVFQVSLDLQDFDSDVGEADAADGDGGFDISGDADTIGVAVTHWDSMGIDGERYEGRYQKAWRPMEGSRARLLIDVPVNVISVDGEAATSAAISVGLEIPITPRWTVTPRAAAAKSWADAYFGGDGTLYEASVSSKFQVAKLGRGDLVIGSMLGVTKSDDINGELDHWVYRGGVAYQFPLKTLVFGRQASARLSYTRTQLEGDPVTIDVTNEVAANLGVRMRESATRNKFELLRFGVLYTFADDYSATTLTLGYRF